MQIYRYPRNSLNGDYLRALVGLGFGVVVLATAEGSTAVYIVFGSIAALFGAFLFRTAQRHITRVAVSEDEIARADFVTQVLPWSGLRWLKLRYFGTRRERKTDGEGHPTGGFWQITLAGPAEGPLARIWRGFSRKMVFESNLDGFEMIAWRAARAARENGVSIDPTSAGNLLALGVDADGESPPPDGIGLPPGRIADLAGDGRSD